MNIKQFEIFENKKLSETSELTWNVLKYGFCSYFALAYAELNNANSFLLVQEYDEDLENFYLVHFYAIENEGLVDAYGVYDNWRSGVNEIVDIEYMELRTKVVTKTDVVKTIEHDMGFDENLYNEILTFVKNNYKFQ